MMKFILVTTLLISAACTTVAQTAQSDPDTESTILIDATGMATANANLIHFHITLNRFHENAGTAFEEHKKLERYLTDFLLEKGIDDERIQANPVRISPRSYSNERGFETNQRVSIQLSDITEFERMQVDLINNGFDNFSGSFGSTGEREAGEQALENAVREARRKAEILAAAAGKKLGSVLNIEHTSTYRPAYRDSGALAMSAVANDGGMLQFQTTIPVSENVRIRFQLLD